MLVLKNLELQIPAKNRIRINGRVLANEIICLQGPSGCGKTTTLRTLAGLRLPLSGEIFLGSVDRQTNLSNVACEKRGAGFLMQGSQLIPSMNVFQNLIFALEIKRPEWSLDLRKESVLKTLERCQLTSLAQSTIGSLSGGEAQRIAFCRVILAEPAFFLLDEPFTGLDPLSRQLFRDLLKEELKLQPRPTVMVSHDVADSQDLSARVVQWPLAESSSLPNFSQTLELSF